MLKLESLKPGDESAFLEAMRETKSGEPAALFAYYFDLAKPFSQYVDWVNGWAKGERLPDGLVPVTVLLAWVGKALVGRISIRHRLNESLAQVGGHIGYVVVPSFRRRGYATEMLRQGLTIAKRLGITKALVTCDDENSASYLPIERNGGVLEGRVIDPSRGVLKRRYWIATG